MVACITVLSGPARSGKTERLFAHYRPALRDGPVGSALWLSPTWRAVAEARGRLLAGDLPGCLGPNIMTFEAFAEQTLQRAGVPVRPLTRLMKRELVRQLIDEQSSRGRLKYFRPIAKTCGLVDLICDFITELKRLEIWPEEFQRACAARGISDKDLELLEVYDAYQQMLVEHKLYDAEGRFWSARDELQKTPADRRTLELVVVDGFTDFTRTQHEILDLLAERSRHLFISLPLEPEPRRRDLFTKPLKTLAELRRRHSELIVEELAPPSDAAWPAMAWLERSLFVDLRARLSSEIAAAPVAMGREGEEVRGIEVLAAARPEGELRLIGAKIKKLLVDGVAKPGEIAVVFRSRQDAESLAAEVFGRMGLPVIIEGRATLDHWPAMRALVRLLRLDLDDWPFDELLAVVGSNFFQPAWSVWRHAATAARVERAIRRLQIPHGRESLLAELGKATARRDQRQQAEAEADGDRDHRTSLDEDFETTRIVLERLARALDELPRKATLADWAKAWQRLALQTGLLRGRRAEGECPREDASQIDKDAAESSEAAGADWAAWDRLREALAADGTLANWLGRRCVERDRRNAFDTLLDILGSEQVGSAGDESGFVRVLSAPSVRSLPIPYLFLAGLSEKAFPPPDREDRLYSEAEYVRLIRAGLPLAARSDRNREEMLLFYETVTRATKHLCLSYPALDEKAQPLSPSPFCQEVEQAFDGRLRRVERTDLSPVPRDDEPLSEQDFRVKAMATALDGNVAMLAGLMKATAEEASREVATEKKEGCGKTRDRRAIMVENLVAGLELNFQRQDRDRFGPAEGMLQSKAARQYLAARYPPQHTFSATELEQYATCPFKFILERVLDLDPLEDLTLRFDVLQRGTLAHNVLAVFHRSVNELIGRPASPLELDPAEYDRLLAAAFDEAAPSVAGNPVQAALREIDRRQVTQWLRAYRAQCEKYDRHWASCESPLKPALFEVSFGRGDGERPSTDQTLEIGAEREVVRLSGRIDRIDLGVAAGHAVFNVLDYKTGGGMRLTAETILRGTTLQLPLYVFAAMELILADRDALPWQAAYWHLRDDGFKPRQALRMYRDDDGRIELEPEWEQIRDSLADVVLGLVRGIRHGRFPVDSADDHCTGYCPWRTVCRVNQVRSLEKTCPPTETTP